MNSEKNNSSNVLILEKQLVQKENLEIDEQTSNYLVEEEKKENANKTLFSNTSSQYVENIKNNFNKNINNKPQNQLAPQIQINAIKTFYNESKSSDEEQKLSYVSLKNDNINEAEENTKTKSDNVFKTEQNQNVNFNNYKENDHQNIIEDKQATNINKSKKNNFKTRLKIICFGTVAVLTCLFGWAIYNSIQIKTLTEELEQANKIYSVNIVSHISNISKADDLTNPDSIFDLSSLSEAEIIPLTPTPEEPVEYSKKSNWFDRLCNWLSNLFN